MPAVSRFYGSNELPAVRIAMVIMAVAIARATRMLVVIEVAEQSIVVTFTIGGRTRPVTDIPISAVDIRGRIHHGGDRHDRHGVRHVRLRHRNDLTVAGISPLRFRCRNGAANDPHHTQHQG